MPAVDVQATEAARPGKEHVVVYDDEPTSIVAYTLCSLEYMFFVESAKKSAAVANQVRLEDRVERERERERHGREG
jgi:hypothetical protein